MNAIKRHPLFTAWIVFCVLVGFTGLWWMQHWRQSARRELASLTRKTEQRAQLLQQTRLTAQDIAAPLPGKPVVAASASPFVAEKIPRKPLDGFIEIAAVTETLRRAAAGQAVALLPDESFGFATYAHEGPATDRLATVHRQLMLTQILVGKLFSARPEKLLAVRREHPLEGGSGDPLETGTDFFQPDPRLDLRVAGLIEGQAIRLEFTGRTRVLRNYLNSLATASEALLVRSVEVEPLQNSSKFAVVVELTEPASSTGSVGFATGQSPPAVWVTAPASRQEVDQTYELFDPPGVERGAPSAETKPTVADGMELLTVKREPYRLQLVGYFGVPGDYTAAFVSPGSPETLFAREGHRFESLGLTVKSIGVRKLKAEGDAGETGYEPTSVAQLWDERRQELVTLVGRERLLTDNPLAVLRMGPPPARSREFRIGEEFQDGAATCRIERIQFEPAEVVVVRQLSGQSQPDPERHVLRPAAGQKLQTGADLVAAGRNK